MSRAYGAVYNVLGLDIFCPLFFLFSVLLMLACCYSCAPIMHAGADKQTHGSQESMVVRYYMWQIQIYEYDKT